jgi:hypothetical protein
MTLLFHLHLHLEPSEVFLIFQLKAPPPRLFNLVLLFSSTFYGWGRPYFHSLALFMEICIPDLSNLYSATLLERCICPLHTLLPCLASSHRGRESASFVDIGRGVV